MSILDWFRRKPKDMLPEQVDDPDPAMQEIVARVWNTGVGETGSIDKDRKVNVSCQFDPKTGNPLSK